jgi:heme o synthase
VRRKNLSPVLCLCKVKIALFAALAAVSGLFSASFPSAVVLGAVVAGVFSLACGAGALNHYQERCTDALMARTAGRPLPNGDIQPGPALLLSLCLMGLGCIILLFTRVPAAALLGLTAVLWYNGFYTWFKARNRLAALPGALVGAIPPAIGWIAGGGELFDLRLAALCFFFFMWQALHFFVHMLGCGREYEKAGLPSLSTMFTESQLGRLIFQWLLAVAVSTQLIVFFGLIQTSVAHVAMIVVSFWLVLEGISFLMVNSRSLYAAVFRKTNCYVLSVTLLTTLDGLFRSPIAG